MKKYMLFLVLLFLQLISFSQTNLTSMLIQLMDNPDAHYFLEDKGWVFQPFEINPELQEYNLTKIIEFNDGNSSMGYITIIEDKNYNKSISLKFYNKSFFNQFKEITKKNYNELSKEIKDNTIFLKYFKGTIVIDLKEKLNEYYQISIKNFFGERNYNSAEIEIEEEVEIEEIEGIYCYNKIIDLSNCFSHNMEYPPKFGENCDNDDYHCSLEAINKFIVNNTIYPLIAQENNITGKVYVTFIVDKMGKVTEVKILKGVDKHLDAEAIRVVSSLPGFVPGLNRRRKPVNVQMDFIVVFKLN